jgi:hypothetical protein
MRGSIQRSAASLQPEEKHAHAEPWAWHPARRIPPGHCQKYGYSLTGNVSGVCPECGEKVDAEAVPKQ